MKTKIIVMVVLLFFLVACTEKEAPSGPIHYKTPFGFSFEYPRTYGIKEASSNGIRVFKNVDEAESPRFSIYPREDEDINIREITEETMIEIVERAYSVSEVGGFENVMVNDIQFVSIDVAIVDDGFTYLLKQAYFNVNDKGYIFIALTEGESFSSLDMYTEVLYSIKATPH